MANSLSISTQLTYAKAQGYLPAFDNAAAATGVDRNLLLAVASRESGMGLSLDLNFLGDGGNGIGLMQIDRNYHKAYAAMYNPRNNYQNVLEGAQILKDELNRYGNNRQYALDAYNTGSGDVDRAVNAGLSPDFHTANHNYGSDVLERYQIIQGLGAPKAPTTPGNVQTTNTQPEYEAQKLVIISGGALLSAVLATSYIAAKRIRTKAKKPST